MTSLFDPRTLLLIPLGLAVGFCFWVLWNISRELRSKKRRRVHRYPRGGQTRVYWPRITAGPRVSTPKSKEAA